jgi:hypothetical protein
MYRCQLCGTVVPPRTPCHRLVVQTRPAQYPFRHAVNRVMHLDKGKWKEKYTDDPGGTGETIQRELNACPSCAANQRTRAHSAEPALSFAGR